MAYKSPHIWHIGTSLGTGNFIGAVMGQGSSATEAFVQFRVSKAGIFSGLSGVASTANGSGTSTLKFRINGADATQTINWTSGQTGLKRDTTNSDTVAVGDLVCVSLTTTAGSITLASVTLLFEATSGSTVQFLMGCSTESFGSQNLDRFFRPVGMLDISTAEASRQNYIQQASTASDLAVYISANGRNTTTAYRLRINAASGNLVANVTSGVTGLVRDSTNSDTIAADDLITFLQHTGANAGTITVENMQVTITSTNSREVTLLGGDTQIRSSTASNTFYMIAGDFGTGGTEIANQSILNTDADITNLSIRNTSNASNRDMVATIRIAGASGNNTVTTPAGVNAWEIDTTNSDTVAPTNLMAVLIVPSGGAGTGNTTYLNISMLATFPASLRVIMS